MGLCHLPHPRGPMLDARRKRGIMMIPKRIYSHNYAKLWIDPTPIPRNCTFPHRTQYTIIRDEDMKTDRVDCRTCRSLTSITHYSKSLLRRRLSRLLSAQSGLSDADLDLADDLTVANTLEILGAGDDHFHTVICHRTTNRFFRPLHWIAVGHYLL